MLEVEAKVALVRPDEVRAALRRLGATATAPAVEEDVFFTHPSRDLAGRDEALRLRRIAPRQDGTDGSFELTYKGPRQPGALKSRVERTVVCGEDPTALLGDLGFRAAVRLRKRRERFRLGTLEVTLDDVEGLGWFAEVEAMGEDRAQAEASVEAALRALGLHGLARVAKSYVELALESGAAAADRM